MYQFRRTHPFSPVVTTQAMPAVTHASAETFGLAMIVEIIVVERVVVSGLLQRVECGTGV